MTQPDRRDHQLEDPDRHDDADLTDSLHTTVQTETVAVEDRRAQDRLHQVIGQCHPPNGGKRVSQPSTGRDPVDPEHHTDPRETDAETSPVVEQRSGEEEIGGIPIAQELTVDAVGDDGEPDGEADDGHPSVERHGTLCREHAEFVQGHADQHHASRTPHAPDEDDEQLHFQGHRHAMFHLLEPTGAVDPEFAGHRFRPGLPARRELLELLRGPVRHRPTEEEIKKEGHGEDQQPESQQPTGAHLAEQVNPQPANPVDEENVAEPEQVRVQQSEDDQPERAAVVQTRRPAAGRLDSRCHQHDARAEQHREDRHEFLIEEDVRDEPDHVVRPGQVPVGGRVEVGGLDHRERLDVHDEDSQQGDPAQNVQCDDAFGSGSGFHVHGFTSVPMLHRGACQLLTGSGSEIMTVDFDFRVYRRRDRRVSPTLMPGEG